MQKIKSPRLLIAALTMCIVAGLFLKHPQPAYAEKVFIDITSPGLRKLPVAVQQFTGAPEVSDVVKADLTFTGLFECLDDAAQIEQPRQPFNLNNWRGLGVELVVKGRSTSGLNMLITAHDIVDGREVLRKEYAASSSAALRQMGHAIANDVYRVLTGKQGIFRTKIAFIGEAAGRKELYTADWDGHKIASTGISGGVLLKPHWSPDGTKLIYSAERFRQWDLFVLDIKSMREKHIRTAAGLTIAGTFFPDNRRFVFSSSRDGNSGLYIGDSVSGQVQKITSSPWIDISPVVAPDGRSFAFVSNRSGSPQIFVADSSGYNIRRLSFQGGYNTTPAWSPNGDRIAYSSLSGGGHQIFLMKPDGTGVTQLTSRGNNEDPSFSPDGRHIVFMSDRDGTKGLYLMHLNGEGQTRITPRGLRATSPNWSPN